MVPTKSEGRGAGEGGYSSGARRALANFIHSSSVDRNWLQVARSREEASFILWRTELITERNPTPQPSLSFTGKLRHRAGEPACLR